MNSVFTMKVLLSASVLVVATAVAPGVGHAQDTDDGGHKFEKTNHVHPVLIDSRVTNDLALTPILSRLDDQADPGTSKRLERTMGEAFAANSFAGEATEADTTAIKYGFILGVLPLLEEKDADKYKQTLGQLEGMSVLHKRFDEPTAKAISAFTEAARGGTFDADLYAEMMEKTAGGIMRNSANAEVRLHGYLTVGMWIGLATIAAEQNSTSASVQDVGNALEHMLLKDARMGGADRKVAALVSKIVAELDKEQVDKTVVSKAVQDMFAIKPDTE